MAMIRVWRVTVDGRIWHFDDLDVALAYLRADLGTNGARFAALDSHHMDVSTYNRLVDAEDARPTP